MKKYISHSFLLRWIFSSLLVTAGTLCGQNQFIPGSFDIQVELGCNCTCYCPSNNLYANNPVGLFLSTNPVTYISGYDLVPPTGQVVPPQVGEFLASCTPPDYGGDQAISFLPEGWTQTTANFGPQGWNSQQVMNFNLNYPLELPLNYKFCANTLSVDPNSNTAGQSPQQNQNLCQPYPWDVNVALQLQNGQAYYLEQQLVTGVYPTWFSEAIYPTVNYQETNSLLSISLYCIDSGVTNILNVDGYVYCHVTATLLPENIPAPYNQNAGWTGSPDDIFTNWIWTLTTQDQSDSSGTIYGAAGSIQAQLPGPSVSYWWVSAGFLSNQPLLVRANRAYQVTFEYALYCNDIDSWTYLGILTNYNTGIVPPCTNISIGFYATNCTCVPSPINNMCYSTNVGLVDMLGTPNVWPSPPLSPSWPYPSLSGITIWAQGWGNTFVQNLTGSALASLPASFTDIAILYFYGAPTPEWFSKWATESVGMGTAYEYFSSPVYSVEEQCNTTINLTNIFVMCPTNPAIVLGSVNLNGCVDTNYYGGAGALSFLQFAVYNNQANPNLPYDPIVPPNTSWSITDPAGNADPTLANVSFIQAINGASLFGDPVSSPGGGLAVVEFDNPGTFSSPNSFAGNYSMKLAGLESETCLWNVNDLHLVFGSPVNLVYDIYNNAATNSFVISCGAVITNNLSCCFGLATIEVTNIGCPLSDQSAIYTQAVIQVSWVGPGSGYTVGPFTVTNAFNTQTLDNNGCTLQVFLPQGTYQYSANVYSKAIGGMNLGVTNYFSIVCCTNSCLQVQCPTNKTVPCNTNWQFDLPKVLSDCCGTNVQINILTTTTNSSCPWYVTRTWLIVDACTNSTTCSQTVTVVDTNPPAILCPSNIVVTSCCAATQVFYTVTASNLCCTNVTVVCTPTNGSFFQPDTTNTVTCWVTDCCSNTAWCSFIVAVLQNTNFQVQCPSNIVVYSCTNVPVTYPQPTVTDPCCGTNWSVVFSPTNDASFHPDTTNTVMCRVTDCCSNTAWCSFTVAVLCTNCPCIGSNTVVAAASFTNLYDFTDQGTPMGSLVLSGNTLYGTTVYGGGSWEGTVFAVNTDGTGFTNLYNFTGGTDGAMPYAGLILSGNTLYGTTAGSGWVDYGTVFAVNTDGTGFTTLYSFTNGTDGATPFGGLILSGNTLYGTTAGTTWDYGNTYGTVFAVDTNGTNFRVLHNFTGGSDGTMPQASLILLNNTLYGTATYGGSLGYGTVFSVKTNGTDFTTLHSFTNGSDGVFPRTDLILSGSTLYGTTGGGEVGDDGTVFAITTNGTGFTTLYAFTGGSDGGWPQAGLILSGNTLYGTTLEGGNSDAGTVFAVNTDGTGFTMLHSFTGSDGGESEAALTLSGNTLYGTASAGGSLGSGTVFALTLTNLKTNCLQIECPSNIVVTSCTNVQEFYAPTVTDLACTNVTVWCDPTNGSHFAPCTTNPVTCYATDCCGNSNSCSFTVTVVDTNPPVLTCGTNITLTIPCNMPWPVPQATNACCTNVFVQLVSSHQISGPCPAIYLAVWRAEDCCGNTATYTNTVTVMDTNPPVISCPSNMMVQSCSPVVYNVEPTVVNFNVTATSSCCSNVPVACSPPSGSTFYPGTMIVTCMATNCCGVVATKTFSVNVYCSGPPMPSPFVTNGGLILNWSNADIWQAQSSTDLINWTTFTSPTSTLPIIINLQSNAAPQQFYRLINTN